MPPSIVVRPFGSADDPEWRRLRHALWPSTSDVDHARDLREYLESPQTHMILVVDRPGGAPRARLRRERAGRQLSKSPVTMGLFLRQLFAILALPGVVAVVIPVWIA